MLSIALLSIALVFNYVINEGSDRIRLNLICLIPLVLFTAVCHLYPDIGDGYFILSCVLSLGVIVTLGMLPGSPLSTDIQIVNILAMPVHLYGLYCFYNSIDYDTYTILITFAITLEWLRLMVRTKTDGIYWSTIWLRNNDINDSGRPKRGNT